MYLNVEKEPLALPLVSIRETEYIYRQWYIYTIDAVEDLYMLSCFVAKEAGLHKLEADYADQVIPSDELSIAGYHYLQPLQAGEELHPKGV